MTVAKLIEVLQKASKKDRQVYFSSSPGLQYKCNTVAQSEHGEIILGNRTPGMDLYLYPIQQTKGEDK